MLRTLILITLLTSSTGPGRAHGPRDEASLRGKIPRAFLRLPEGTFGILVEKSTQSLILYRGSETGEALPIRVVQANTGERDGDKEVEGDLRTPESIYFFNRIIDGGELPPEYGIGAFATDFPNIFDRLGGRDGSNIWLHATDEPARVAEGYNTRGCVVVTNDQLLELEADIRVGRGVHATGMVVEHELNLLDPVEASRQRAEVEELIARWEEAWESRRIEPYMDFYSRSMWSMGRDWEAWKAYKERLARTYDFIRVEISGLHIYMHDGELVAAFDQRYESDRFLAHSAKRLYFRMEDGGWRIVRETSQPIG
ncbi:MAG: L,D-transpeptidase family protein [bacterium]